MKNIVLLFSVLALLACSDGRKPQRDADGVILKNGQFYDSQEEETNEVWICTGASSHAYHSTDECYGIQACGGEIKKISIDDAISMGRTPCHYCHEVIDDYDEKDFEEDEYETEDEESYDPDRDDSGVYIIDGKAIRAY